MAYITPDQAAKILAETDGAVKGIAPDSPLKSGPLTPAPELTCSNELVPRKPKMEDPGQSFGYSKKYAFFKTAVQSALRSSIRVYLVDSGYDPRSGQIRQEGLE